MRPDTPQHYEYIRVEQIKGKIENFINVNPWTQFYDLKDRKDIPLSYADHVTMRDCECDCDIYFNVAGNDEQYIMSDFTFENLTVNAKVKGGEYDCIKNMTLENVKVNIV